MYAATEATSPVRPDSHRPLGRRAFPQMLRVVDSAPWMVDGIPVEQARIAARIAVAHCSLHDVGPWRHWPRLEAPAYGLLIVRGFLLRTVRLNGSTATELLGADDIIVPWADDGVSASVIGKTEWTVLSPMLVAHLDQDFADRVRPLPAVCANLVNGAVRRAQSLCIYRACEHNVRVERRLEMLFWHFADRWGRVCREGTVLDLPHLTHELLSEMVGARRPSVSTALGKLRRDGRLLHQGDRWILAPGGLAEPLDAGCEG